MDISKLSNPEGFTHVALEFLLSRVRASKAGYGGNETLLNAFRAKLWQRFSSLPYVAMSQAVHEMIWTSSENNFDEEHHTSSLMGHFVTNMSWYVMSEYSARILKGQTTDSMKGLYDIKWASQGKTTEARTGGDFALALPIGNKRYKFFLFQAKRADDSGSGSDSFNLYRCRAEKKTSSHQDGVPSGAIQDEARPSTVESESSREVDVNLLDVIRNYKHLDRDLPERNKSAACHQLESLLRAEHLGRTYCEVIKDMPCSSNFAYYIIWNRKRTVRGKITYPSVPTIYKASHAADKIIENLKRTKKIDGGLNLRDNTLERSDFAVETSNADFIEQFHQWSTREKHMGVKIDLERATKFLGSFAEICPGIDFVLLDGSGEGSDEGLKLDSAFQQAGYQVSNVMQRSVLKSLDNAISTHLGNNPTPTRPSTTKDRGLGG